MGKKLEYIFCGFVDKCLLVCIKNLKLLSDFVLSVLYPWSMGVWREEVEIEGLAYLF